MPGDASGEIQSFMDFSGVEFTDIVSFAGRMLIGADFRVASFNEHASFSAAEFLGPTCFDNAKFHKTGKDWFRLTSFDNSTFHDRVSFSSVSFPFYVNFSEAVFRGPARFEMARFRPHDQDVDTIPAEALFSRSCFLKLADFSKVTFGCPVRFDEADLAGPAVFRGTFFNNDIVFDNSRFRAKTSFRGATFRKPPDFFETELHEDVDFNLVDWKKAELSYRRSNKSNDQMNESMDEVISGVDHAVRSWDRLALIMSQRERLADRHEFFRLKMRAQRQRDGRGLLSLLNWLFDKSSDYGWGVGRALTCLAGQIFVMGIIFTWMALKCSSGSTTGWQHVLRDGLYLSFANSHAFLGLASGDGWLDSSRKAIVEPCEPSLLFNFIGTFQAVLGPVLLFLVLLTLRNRFRLG